VFGRNFLTFTIVTGIAGLPNLLLQRGPSGAVPFVNPGLATLGIILILVLYLISQAMVLNAAFQVVNGRPIRLAESLGVGLRRFFPILGLAIVAALAMVAYLIGVVAAVATLGNLVHSPGLTVLASFAAMIPAVMLYLMWFVATPACVVERQGPIRSLGRSRALTKGHRLKLFGLTLLVLLPGLIISGVIAVVVIALGSAAAPGLGALVARIVSLIWNAVWMAFHAILGTVAYHDLRAAKEGLGPEQIATVFE
jgi:hypothetical protein